jgi:hypothetical protein
MMMDLNRRRYVLALVAACLGLGFAARPSIVQAQGHPNCGILSPDSKHFGASYGEWSARWWQWAFSLPIDNHPLYDTADCREGQRGKVWFLGASFGSTINPVTGNHEAIATRHCSVPAGKALFIAIGNNEASTIEGNGTTDQELRAAAQSFQDFFENLSCEIDGRSVHKLDNSLHTRSYRVQSPLYTFGPLPENNVLQSLGVDAPAGSKSGSVADGVYVMLAPLSHGHHTIHFHGDAPFPGFPFLLDITYHITVK